MKEKNKYIFCYSIAGIALLLSAVFSFIDGSNVWVNPALISNRLFYIFESTVCLGYLTDLKYRTNYNKKTALQFFAIYVFLDLFYFSALLYPQNHTDDLLLIVSEILFLSFGTFFWIYKINWDEVKISLRNIIKKIPLVCCICLAGVAIVIGMDNYNLMPAWDNNIYLKDYFSQLSSWDFTFSSLITVKYCGHASQAVTPIVLLSRWIGRTYAYYVFRAFILLNSLLLTFAVFSIVGCLCTKKVLHRTVITLAVLVYPSVLPMQMISLDDFSLLFLVLWLFSCVNSNRVYETLFAFLFLFSKEPNVVLYIGIVAGSILTGKKVREIARLSTPVFAWTVIYVGPSLLGKVFSEMTQRTDQLTEKTSFIDRLLSLGWNPSSNQNSFSLDRSYFINMAKQILTFHFMWLVLFIGFVSLIVLAVKNRKRINNLIKDLLPLVSGVVFESVFLCVYVTYPMYRYRFIINILVLIICFTLVYHCVDTVCLKGKPMIAFPLLSVLFLIESYYTVDPVTLRIGSIFSTGNGTCISSSNGLLYISDEIVTNHQGMEYPSFMQKILQTVNYSENDLIIFPKMLEADSTRNHLGIYGYWSKKNYYKEDERKLYLLEIGEDYGTPVNRASLLEDGKIVSIDAESDLDREYEHVYILNLPFADAFDVKTVASSNYDVINQYETVYRSWKCDILQIK